MDSNWWEALARNHAQMVEIKNISLLTNNSSLIFIYCNSKESWPILYSNLLYKIGLDLLVIQYMLQNIKFVFAYTFVKITWYRHRNILCLAIFTIPAEYQKKIWTRWEQCCVYLHIYSLTISFQNKENCPYAANCNYIYIYLCVWDGEILCGSDGIKMPAGCL